MAGSNPALPTYPLQRSVRLRSSASASFSRSVTVAGNRKTWTWSGWVKRGTLGSSQHTLLANNFNTTGGLHYIQFTNDTLIMYVELSAGIKTGWQTTAVFRDPSAWYHVVVVFDTTQAAVANMGKIYVNGVLQVATVSSFSASFISQNADGWINAATYTHYIGSGQTAYTQYFDGYLEEINFIDGQALTPSSFGAYNSYGVWSPAKYTGSYGTNGFYLNFQDNSALTTTANVGIGKDSSGNGNYWTSNNISLTAGATYDSMVDVPTLTSNTNANFPTLNAVETNYGTLSNANLSASLTVTGSTGRQARGTFIFPSSGKFYFEVNPSALGVVGQIGVARFSSATNGGNGISPAFSAGDVYLYLSNGQKQDGVTASAYGASFTTSDVIGVAVDVDAGTLTFYKNNVSQGTAYSSLTLSNYYPVVHAAGAVGTASYNVNFGQRPFTYTPPTGFNRLNTYNLPDSIVPVGAQYMAATTYTGNGTTQSITNTVNGFSLQPDFVWYKGRSQATGNALFDSVRGALQYLASESTSAESTLAGSLTSFNSSGFSIGNQAGTNANAQNYVGWQWRASNASAVTNTAGTISSQVSANQTAGFSIVSFTGVPNNASTYTIGHGLGVAPKFIIAKNRDLVDDWYCYQESLGATKRISLNTTAAAAVGGIWGNTTPTSSVFSLVGNAMSTSTSQKLIAYCFAAVPGYSAFGSYTGNGSADGPFVYLGFRPRWVLLKSTTIDPWLIIDSSRQTYNVMGPYLIPNSTAAEGTASFIDFTSNGFKIRNTGSSYNTSSQTYIYACFAENPFKNSLAR
jgi:hypothetical protein